MIKSIITVLLVLISISESSAQDDSLRIYTLHTFGEYDFLEFGGKKEFIKSIYKNIKYPAIAREWKKEKEGVIRAVLRRNNKNDYDVFTFSGTESTLITFHEEVERVLSEIVKIPNEGSDVKYSVEMFFDFRINRECIDGNTNGRFCILGFSSVPRRSST